MFKHSIRVPRNYKIAANIVQKVSEEGGSFKTLLYDDKLKHFRIDVLYALVHETIKHAIDIEKVFESTGVLVNEPRLNPWLAKVLTAELLYGKKKLPGNSKPEQTILSYKEQFMKLIPEVQDIEKSKVRRPRYVRVNTNLLTTSDAIRAFQDDGFKFIRCTSGPYNDYLKQIQNLADNEFTQDYHVKTIFVFPPRIKLHDHEFYIENKIILQDKATALAVHLLAPPSGSVVLDMCAAPGMKTTQLAAYMRNEGKIYAVERDHTRYLTLCEFVEATGSTCVETLNKDSLQIKRGDLDDVEYILLDPSCSGSGMELSVHNYVEESRMVKLTSLQEKFLKHAMNSFPNAKRIVYSTCSIFPEENERVITNIVKASRAKWRVKNVRELLKGQWNNFGSGMYGSMGTRCIYAKPDSDFTIGFFLAVLDRDFRDGETQENQMDDNIEATVYDKVVRKRNNDESHNTECIPIPKEYAIFEDVHDESNNPKTKKKKQDKNNIDESYIQNIETHDQETTKNSINENLKQNSDVQNLKKKKRKSKVKEEENDIIIENNVGSTDNCLETKDMHDNNTSLEQGILGTTKNKKRKKQSCIAEIETETDPRELVESYNETEKQIKKKKKCKERENDSSRVVVENILDKCKLYENNDHVEVAKKKNKKGKKSDSEYKQDITLSDVPIDVVNKNTPENGSLIENNDESKVRKKKKKKENDSKEAVVLLDRGISTELDNINSQERTNLLIKNDDIEMSKKKIRNNRENKLKKATSETIENNMGKEHNSNSENNKDPQIINFDVKQQSKPTKKKLKDSENKSLENIKSSDAAHVNYSKKAKKKKNVCA